jgi:hypothetical protein
MGKDRNEKSGNSGQGSTTLIQRALIGIAVLAAVCLVVYLATHEAKAGQNAYTIPAPQGAKFEVNGKVDLISQREGSMVVVTVLDNDPQAKAKARWFYAGNNCQSVGTVAHVLSDIQRCANNAMRTK